ncbi:uncharacterized protein LOC124306424 isoform X1 [Neodiprion virginianus]|uniref:uncharacterized protein LOC124306424 isoform X1 n=2 Tax=Neodiprion virginianus TaxID=2961670 RepID=UPI001EE697C9|nr:uncharacterized protein LOC124306424 isoform X1 [Neodiprion virginianus]
MFNIPIAYLINMSSKVNTERKAIALKSKRESSEGDKQVVLPVSKQLSNTAPPGDVLVFDNCSTTVQVTVKTKGRKRTSTMVSGSPTNHKAIEEKKKASGNGEHHHNWGRILGDQNRIAVKQNLQQSLQQYAARTHTSKSTRQSTTDSKEARKLLEVHRSQRYELGQVASKHLDEIPTKQDPPSKKSSDHMKTHIPASTMPSSTSIASSMESIVVVDRAVQCGGIFDCSNDRFGVFNPVRTLGFLMKELEGLVRDERSSKILSEMEQALLRIPTEPGKPTPADVDAIALRVQLEASTAKLESTSQKLNATCESLREQRDSLQQQVQKQTSLLEDARHRETVLESDLKRVQTKLDEATTMASSAQKIISELKDDTKRIETLQKVIADLRTELNDQIELAQQRFMEGQYLRLEKEKLLVLSAYKDSQLAQHRTAVKELQILITEQLTELRETYKNREDSPDRHSSMLHAGKACSSPTPTSSEHSNTIQPWHGLSDISLSTVEPNTHNFGDQKAVTSQVKNSSFHGEMAGDSERKRTVKDVKTQLEFISLPGGETGETSRTMSLPIYKGEESKRHSNAGIGDEGEASCDKSNDLSDIVAGIAEVEKPTTTDETDGKNFEKRDQNGIRSLFKPRKSPLEKTRKHRSNKDHSRNKSVARDIPTQNKEYSSGNPIDISIKEQFQNIFKDIRQQSRIPVNIPSPPRHYPHSDWSDSSLPSISGVSESNIA